MNKYNEYRKSYPDKTDAEIIEAIGNELSQKVETIGELLKRIYMLENPLSYIFGDEVAYKKCDVVVWRGVTPCIGKVERKCNSFNDSFYLSESHSSCHFSNLRYARPDEIKRLGINQIMLIEKSEC